MCANSLSLIVSDEPFFFFRLELERQIAEREESTVNEDMVMTAAERKINAQLLRKALAAAPACCICGQCPDCCAWQQAHSRLKGAQR